MHELLFCNLKEDKVTIFLCLLTIKYQNLGSSIEERSAKQNPISSRLQIGMNTVYK